MLSLQEWQAIRITLVVSVIAVVCALPFAILLGWILAKRRFPGKILLEVFTNLPLVLPPVVTGYLLMVSMGRNGFVGGFLESSLGIRFVFDWKGAALASAVVSFPLFVRPIRLAFEQVDDRLVHAARTLGASRLDAFFSVALPLARPGIYAGCLLALARSMGEFGATIMIAGNIPNQTQTISLMIYSLLESPGGMHNAWRLALASVALSALALVISEYLDRTQRQRIH
jgi:molybdate transport system permease protein